MGKSKENPVIAATTGAAIDLDQNTDQEMTDKTAAKLRALCEEKGETFDTALTEEQAQARIEALESDG
ncbi:hypothetical protein R5H30_12110 [Sulfitobacter sp. D35]|uniref:hypothetical protein n=1 Tax=Sulfitobacter sp. D35 TaxID=3083252 RepID=UPI00296FCFAB|nr:hypothetical protein [Sulfitobacter sp. D35]MDW4498730.1 hypothetical protein [Sulfitobacter sp. D35]